MLTRAHPPCVAALDSAPLRTRAVELRSFPPHTNNQRQAACKLRHGPTFQLLFVRTWGQIAPPGSLTSARLRMQYGTDDVDAENASLWFAGKQMLPDNRLKAHVGRHEKTKAVVKLQKKGQGAPAREPVRSRRFEAVHQLLPVQCTRIRAQVSIANDLHA